MDKIVRMIKSLIAEEVMSIADARMAERVRVKVEQEEKAAVIIQAFLRTTLVRVKLERTIRLWGAYAKNWVRYATFDLGPWWKDYRGRQEEKARARAAAKARKRAKAKRRERAKKIAGDEILGGVRIQMTCG